MRGANSFDNKIMIKYIVMAVCVIVLVAAVSFIIEFSKMRRNSTKTKKRQKLALDGRPAIVSCPLCGSPLLPGEEIVSKVWRPMNVPQQRIIISGCPHCLPLCEPGLTRKCPKCHEIVGADGHLVAHLFNLKNGKKHVTVVGCINCCKYEKLQKK